MCYNVFDESLYNEISAIEHYIVIYLFIIVLLLYIIVLGVYIPDPIWNCFSKEYYLVCKKVIPVNLDFIIDSPCPKELHVLENASNEKIATGKASGVKVLCQL